MHRFIGTVLVVMAVLGAGCSSESRPTSDEAESDRLSRTDLLFELNDICAELQQKRYSASGQRSSTSTRVAYARSMRSFTEKVAALDAEPSLDEDLRTFVQASRAVARAFENVPQGEGALRRWSVKIARLGIELSRIVEKLGLTSNCEIGHSKLDLFVAKANLYCFQTRHSLSAIAGTSRATSTASLLEEIEDGAIAARELSDALEKERPGGSPNVTRIIKSLDELAAGLGQLRSNFYGGSESAYFETANDVDSRSRKLATSMLRLGLVDCVEGPKK